MFASKLWLNMKIKNSSIQNNDIYGIIVCALCVLHCIATPLIFFSVAASNDNNISPPFLWKNLDYLFLAISLFIVYNSAKNTTKPIMKYILGISWLVLFLVISNEKIDVFHIPELVTYIASINLAVIHLYNYRYCRC
tara:strand:+ start:468 stop:878 length:411 start_codon:yes stop_codon:yes gene_type:complete